MLYLGSSIVYGRGRAVVTETGMQTQMGHIADALTQTKENKTPLQLRLTQLSRILTWLVLGICAVVFAVGVLRAGTINGRVVLDTFLIAVSLAVAAIPEGLAAVVTIVLSIGVTNMSRRGAVIRRLTAVETLGCAQVICSDKTGTLTQNRMTVTECAGSDEHLLAMAMALCVDAVHDPETDTVTGEPTEAALVRPQITCGTHALTVALSANLLPGDTLLSPVGAPYDTLEEVIGIRPSACSLKEYGVHYRQVDLLPDYGFDYPAIEQALRGGVKLVTIQRSKGYATRPTFSVQQIGELIAFCKRIDPNVICMVDNCYGEFVETIEPSDLGADMIVGSLIKTPAAASRPSAATSAAVRIWSTAVPSV